MNYIVSKNNPFSLDGDSHGESAMISNLGQNATNYSANGKTAVEMWPEQKRNRKLHDDCFDPAQNLLSDIAMGSMRNERNSHIVARTSWT